MVDIYQTTWQHIPEDNNLTELSPYRFTQRLQTDNTSRAIASGYKFVVQKARERPEMLKSKLRGNYMKKKRD